MNEPRLGTRSVAAAAALTLALGVLALATGCDYFRPTRPELPAANYPVPRYTQPETTLVTLGLAIEDKAATNGQSAYIGGFANPATDGAGYIAEFDPITVARFEGQSTEWDIGREEIFYANLSQLLPNSIFLFAWGTFPGAPDDDEESTPRIYYRSYLIRATPDDGRTYVTVARGNAALHMIQVGGAWKIVRWVDSEDPEASFEDGEFSFGQLRLEGP